MADVNSYSHSKVSDYRSCPRKYKYRWIDRVIPKEKSKALALGGHMADAIAAFREGKSRAEVLDTFTEAWDKGGRVLSLDRDEDPKRSVPRALEILSHYMDEHPDEPEQVIMPEVRFEEKFQTNGINFIWRGRIDGVMQVGKEVAIVEDKTASVWGNSGFADLQDSYQVLSYLKIAKDRGIFEQFNQRLPKVVLNVIYIHASKFYGSGDPRRIISKFNQDIENAWNEICGWIYQIEMMRKIDLFPCADASICHMYGGCEYLPLKFAQDSQKQILLKTEYTIKPEENDA